MCAEVGSFLQTRSGLHRVGSGRRNWDPKRNRLAATLVCRGCILSMSPQNGRMYGLPALKDYDDLLQRHGKQAYVRAIAEDFAPRSSRSGDIRLFRHLRLAYAGASRRRAVCPRDCEMTAPRPAARTDERVVKATPTRPRALEQATLVRAFHTSNELLVAAAIT
jgi:hypothetical protein